MSSHSIVSQVLVCLCGTSDTKFIDEQLYSIKNQVGVQVALFVSVDDERSTVLSYWHDQLVTIFGEGNFQLQRGSLQGFSANFLSCLMRTDSSADFFALSDQDDIWEPNKLSRAVSCLSAVPSDIPGLYGARTRLVDQYNQEIGLSPLFGKKPSFSNAIVQSFAGGNTMLLNRQSVQLIKRAGLLNVVSHDWWIYMLVAGVGGHIIYDPLPLTRYRQHNKNLIGGNCGWSARFKRMAQLMQGYFSQLIETNIQALEQVSYLFSLENQNLLKQFVKARKATFFVRCFIFFRLGIYRQTLLGNLGIFVAVLFNRI